MGIDVVGEREHRLGVGTSPLHGDVELVLVGLVLEVDDMGMHWFPRCVQMFDEIDQALLVQEYDLARLLTAFVAQRDLETLVQESGLSKPRRNRAEVELGSFGEGFGR